MNSIKYKQRKAYGCGLYALSNLLDYGGFLTDRRLEESKTGNNIPQLNRYLYEENFKCGVDVMYYDCCGDNIEGGALHLRPENPDHVFPLLFQVKMSENGLNHLISGIVDSEGVLTVYDSLRSTEFITTIEGLKKDYYELTGIYCLLYVDGGNYYMFNKL